MQARVNDNISPCVAKDSETGIGIVLVPGDYVDFAELGINAQRFITEHLWAFDDDVEWVEEATSKPGRRRATKRAAGKIEGTEE